ncbi:MAG: secretin and TonB N-terminal domain-containing protein, partial [Candidatus Omnitrophota bacterium]
MKKTAPIINNFILNRSSRMFIGRLLISFLFLFSTHWRVFSGEDNAKESVNLKQKDTAGNQTDEAVSSLSSKTLLEIKRLDGQESLYSVELRNVSLSDLFRVLAHDYKLNFLINEKVKGTVTASFTNVSLEEALESIAEMYNITLKKKGKIVVVEPHLVSEVFILEH